MHAKAIHYLETQFNNLTRDFQRSLQSGCPQKLSSKQWYELLGVCEQTIHLYNLLGLKETANGILFFIQQHFSMLTGDLTGRKQFTVVSAEMYEKLQWWSQSLRAYRQRLKDSQNVRDLVGMMTALDALGDFPRVLELFRSVRRRRLQKAVTATAPLGARAAWLLRSWEDLTVATEEMPTDEYAINASNFYKSVLAVHNRDPGALALIGDCRRRLDGSLCALVAESYDRAYRVFVGLQQLSELEEIVQAQQDSSLLAPWKELWQKRLLALASDPTEWQGTMINHMLVMQPEDELPMWIRFAGISRARGHEIVATEVVERLLNGKSVVEALSATGDVVRPEIALAAATHLYEIGNRGSALRLLRSYVGASSPTLDPKHLSLCRATVSEWLTRAHTQYAKVEAQRDEVLEHLTAASELDPGSGQVWHQWATAHHEISDALGRKDPACRAHVVAAVHGYLNSIRITPKLQEVLGFLSLWFSNGHDKEVDRVVAEVIPTISVNVWLLVLPQIIARIHTPSQQLNEAVHNLLVSVARSHPQALLYPLNVNNTVHSSTLSLTGEMASWRESGMRVLQRIVEMHGANLVNEARMVCQELNRCAVLWSEMWVDELLRIHGQWERDRDAKKVWGALQHLISLFDSPSKTPCEESFLLDYGRQLREASQMVHEAALGQRDIGDAWDLFDSVLRTIEEHIKSITSLVMEFVSPKLVDDGRDLSLVVPGQYSPDRSSPRIARFLHDLQVMSSKQHPRRITMVGDNGVHYRFLLKGHEDLRQDERVMQLLGLVNTVLDAHLSTTGRDCTAKLYSVTPLGDNAGLVGWVDNTITLHVIIKEHRAANKIPMTAEIHALQSLSHNTSRLLVIQQQQCFEASQEVTEGNDIARYCWSHAPSAEAWLDRRTTFIQSLASMSMIGHILGLGDRHPSNLMLHTASGRVVHIDFGDCFEVAMMRPHYPEKVPFRLTRMLVKAMDIGGINGQYHHGCVSVMDVIRQERGSVLAMLEAFVHDPLVSWRLEETEASGSAADGDEQHTEPERTQPLHDAMRVGSVRSMTASAKTLRTVKCMRPKGRAQYNEVAKKAIVRVKEKLQGSGFVPPLPHGTRGTGNLTVTSQVARLIEEATSSENLCQHYVGWCPFW